MILLVLPILMVIEDIEATGSSGHSLTQLGNSEEIFLLSSQELLNFLRSEGQAMELEVSLVANGEELYKIIIRDGVSIDVLGSNELLPAKVLGDYITSDRSLFMW